MQHKNNRECVKIASVHTIWDYWENAEHKMMRHLKRLYNLCLTHLSVSRNRSCRFCAHMCVCVDACVPPCPQEINIRERKFTVRQLCCHSHTAESSLLSAWAAVYLCWRLSERMSVEWQRNKNRTCDLESHETWSLLIFFCLLLQINLSFGFIGLCW